MALVNATLTDSAATVFTCSNAGGSAITSLWLKNHDTSARTITVHACPTGDGDTTATDENMIMEVSVPANDTYIVAAEKLILANTDTIKAFASVTSISSITVSYLDL